MALGKKKLKNQRPILEVCQAESVRNAASTLLANIRFSSVDAPLKSVVITSSVPNEGKTTVALSLAISAGQSGNNVLVVECDMRRRSLRAIVGVKPRYGIHALLTGGCTLEQAVVSTEFEGVSFLDAEAGIPNPDGILSSRLYANLLATLHEKYDYIIIDTPPITAFPDASIAASKADAVVLVAREKYTDKREITYSLQQLRAADANVLGVALNCQESASGSYGYYYGYYYDEKTVAADSPEAKEALERVKQGDTSVTVTPVGDAAAPLSANEAETAVEAADETADASVEVVAGEEGAEAAESAATPVTPVTPTTPASAPTAAAPGSKR